MTIAYNNAPPVLTWMLDDYIELSEAQKSWVRERLARTIAWHRAHELPEYRRFFAALSSQIDDNVSLEEARNAQRDIRAYYHRLLEHMLPDMAQLLVQLDAEQIAQVERKFAAENRKIVKESLEGTPEERRALRATRYVKNLQEWTGRLTAAQRELIAARASAIPEYLDERMGERRYRQNALLELARAKPSREQAMAGLQRLLINTDSWRRPEYREKMRERDEQLFELISALSATLSAGQRSHVKERFHGFMRDITELTASN
jgi:hypothetical protein